MLVNTRLSFVAPLAGSVDRNHEAYNIMTSQRESLPSRGAWIEIHTSLLGQKK